MYGLLPLVVGYDSRKPSNESAGDNYTYVLLLLDYLMEGEQTKCLQLKTAPPEGKSKGEMLNKF